MRRIEPNRVIFGALALLVALTATPRVSCGEPVYPRPGRVDEIRELFEAGRYAEAEAAARADLVVNENEAGRESLEVAELIDLLVEILSWNNKGAETETLDLAQRVLRIREDQLGSAHPETARSLCRLGMVRLDRAEFDLAVPLVERSLKLRRELLGTEHPSVAESLEVLGLLRLRRGELVLARRPLQEALGMRTRTLGPEHPLVAQSMMSLGTLFYALSDYSHSQRQFETALRIRIDSLGPEHPKVAGSLHNLAVLHQVQGKFEQARELYERALEIRIRVLVPDDPRLAVTHVAVGSLAQMTGDYTAARTHYERALDSIENRLGEDSEDYAVALTKLAELNHLSGDFPVAREQLERALRIRREALGSDHPDVAKNLNALGLLLLELGDASSARARFEEGLQIRDLPSDSPQIAGDLMGLGLALTALGEIDRARDLLGTSVQMYERGVGEKSPELIAPLRALGDVLLSSGEATQAEVTYRRARSLAERIYDPGHRELALILLGEARSLAAQGRRSLALQAALTAATIARTHLGLTAEALSQRQALAYAAYSNSSIDTVLSILISSANPRAAEVVDAWDAVMRTRGRVLDEMVARRRYVEGSSDPKVHELADRLRAVRQRLAHVLVRGPADADPAHYATLVTSLRARDEELARQLAVESLPFRQEQASDRLGFADLAANLPAGSALVAYTQFRRYDAGNPSRPPVPALIALVLPANGAAAVAIDLGAMSAIDASIDAWFAEVMNGPFRGAEGSPRNLARYVHVGTELRKRIWDPLRDHLSGAARVFIVPDGSLNLVSFAALPIGVDRYLVEHGPLLHLLTAEKDLVPVSAGDPLGKGLLALGGADFDHLPSDPDARRGTDSVERPYRGLRGECIDLRSTRFDALPHTLREAEDVAILWPASDEAAPVTLVTGVDASESAFKRLAPGRRALHVATHGFFLNGRCPAGQEGWRAIGGLSPSTPPTERDPQSLLSGLVLAGANLRAEMAVDAEDGILTAEEIATLDLRGVEWAVLSGCDTGRGEVQVGEGVLGLRRAFRIAGARTVIMSLWSVEDRAGLDWMRALYDARRIRRMSTAEATRTATKTVLVDRRATGQTTHPFYWGGFVAAGHWE